VKDLGSIRINQRKAVVRFEDRGKAHDEAKKGHYEAKKAHDEAKKANDEAKNALEEPKAMSLMRIASNVSLQAAHETKLVLGRLEGHVKAMPRHLIEHDRQLVHMREMVHDALTSARTLAYPMALLPFDVFKAGGQLRSHEQLRARLIMVEDYPELSLLVKRCPFTVFFSHQWLGCSLPDPSREHYLAMCTAGDQLYHKIGIDPKELMLWLDYSSIPQKNKHLQKMAIASIAVYASTCRFFVTIAPNATHTDHSVPCSLKTYMARGWCRLENLARLCVGGPEGMFVFSSSTVGLVPVVSIEQLHLNEIVQVFTADFSVPEDKEQLVPVLLGLYSLLLQWKSVDSHQRTSRRQEDPDWEESSVSREACAVMISQLVEEHSDSIFPKKYFFETPQMVRDLMSVALQHPEEDSQRHRLRHRHKMRADDHLKDAISTSDTLLHAMLRWNRRLDTMHISGVADGLLSERVSTYSQDYTHLFVGERVFHPTHGPGTVISATPGSREVKFDDGSTHAYKTHSFGKLTPLDSEVELSMCRSESAEAARCSTNVDALADESRKTLGI